MKITFFNAYSNPLYNKASLYLNGNLVTELIIQDNVTSICNFAFYNCRSIESIVLPESITSIGISAFEYCENLENVYYKGTLEQWQSILINSENNSLLNATITYNY